MKLHYQTIPYGGAQTITEEFRIYLEMKLSMLSCVLFFLEYIAINQKVTSIRSTVSYRSRIKVPFGLLIFYHRVDIFITVEILHSCPLLLTYSVPA